MRRLAHPTDGSAILWRVGTLAVALIVPATIIPAYLNARDRDARKFEDWQVAGAQCPSVQVSGPAPPKTIVVENVAFSRRTGNVACTVLTVRQGLFSRAEPVCHFNSPSEVRVTSRTGTFSFAPGLGRPAAVYVQDGRPRCVVAVKKSLLTRAHDRPYAL